MLKPMMLRTRVKLTKVAFDDLRPGDRILVSYGTVTVSGVEINGNRATVFILGQEAITWHKDNWPIKVEPSGTR